MNTMGSKNKYNFLSLSHLEVLGILWCSNDLRFVLRGKTCLSCHVLLFYDDLYLLAGSVVNLLNNLLYFLEPSNIFSLKEMQVSITSGLNETMIFINVFLPVL